MKRGGLASPAFRGCRPYLTEPMINGRVGKASNMLRRIQFGVTEVSFFTKGSLREVCRWLIDYLQKEI